MINLDGFKKIKEWKDAVNSLSENKVIETDKISPIVLPKLNNIYQPKNRIIISDDFEKFKTSLPINLQDTSSYRLKRYWELNGKPKSFNDTKNMFSKQEDGCHANSVAYNKDLDEYEFMKLKNHPTVKMELDWYNSPDGAEFKKQYDLLDDNNLNYYKYVKRK